MSDRPQIGQRLRDLADRPIEKPHPRAAIALIVLIAVVAVGLNVVTFPVHNDKPAAARPAAPPAETPTPAVAPEGAPGADVKVADLRAAKRAALRFLHSYLPYTYGQRPASHVRGASPAVRDFLRHNPPRQPAGHDRHRPRPVIAVITTSENATPTMVSFDAQVTDTANPEAASYNVAVTTELDRDRWVVTNAG